MTIEEIEALIKDHEEKGLAFLILKYNVGPKWRYANQKRVRTQLGLADIIGPSYAENHIVVSLSVETAKRNLKRMKGN